MVNSDWKNFVVRGKLPAENLTLAQVGSAAEKVYKQLINKNKHFRDKPVALQVLPDESCEPGTPRWDIIFPFFCCKVTVVEGMPKYTDFVKHDHPKVSVVEAGLYLLVSYVSICEPLESSAQIAHNLAIALRDELERQN